MQGLVENNFFNQCHHLMQIVLSFGTDVFLHYNVQSI